MPFLIAYVGIYAVGMLPTAFGSPVVPLLGAICSIAALALVMLWMWQALGVAVAALSAEDPARRNQQLAGWLIVAFLFVFGVSLGWRVVASPREIAVVDGALHPFDVESLTVLFGFPAYLFAAWLTSITICHADGSQKRGVTLLQIAYAPILSVFLYPRLDALQGKAEAHRSR